MTSNSPGGGGPTGSASSSAWRASCASVEGAMQVDRGGQQAGGRARAQLVVGADNRVQIGVEQQRPARASERRSGLEALEPGSPSTKPSGESNCTLAAESVRITSSRRSRSARAAAASQARAEPRLDHQPENAPSATAIEIVKVPPLLAPRRVHRGQLSASTASTRSSRTTGSPWSVAP